MILLILLAFLEEVQMASPQPQFDKDHTVLTALCAEISVHDQGKRAMFSADTGLELILTNGKKVTIPKEKCSPHVVAVILERVKLGTYSIVKTLAEDPSLTAYSVTVVGGRARQRFTTISQKL
jgi:hypothetical protein